MDKKTRVHLFILGRVQGVFFRENTKKKAKELKLTGWVRNLEDKRVEILAEGEKENIEDLIEWIKKGSFLAKVENIEINWQDYKKEFKDFQIIY